MRIITHHGFDFGIDTADWGKHSDGAEQAGNILENWLLEFGPSETAELHDALKHLVDGEDYNEALVEEADRAGSDAALYVFRHNEWAEIPQDGHNCNLVAL